jgi:hypothetical protein
MIHAFDLANQEKLITDLFDLLTAESLNIDSADLTSEWSTINNNGAPFQLVVSSGGRERELRFLTEVGAGAFHPIERLAQSYKRLRNICEQLGVPEHFSSIETVGKILLSQNSAIIKTFYSGSIWIGLGFRKNESTRLSIYFEGGWGSLEERWVRLFKLLIANGCFGAVEQLRRVIRPASTFSKPMGAAIDLDVQGIRKIKFYFRTFRTATERISMVLQRAGIVSHDDTIKMLTQTFLDDGEDFPPSALVYYLAISPSTDRIEATKIDVCAHCIGLGDREARNRWSSLARRLSIDIDDYLIALNVFSSSAGVSLRQECHALLGVGLDACGRIKLNAYLRPAII